MIAAECGDLGFAYIARNRKSRRALAEIQKPLATLQKTARVGRTLNSSFQSQGPQFAFQTWSHGENDSKWKIDQLSGRWFLQKQVAKILLMQKEVWWVNHKREREWEERKEDWWMYMRDVHFFSNWQLIQVSLWKSTHAMLPSHINRQSRKQQGWEQKT